MIFYISASLHFILLTCIVLMSGQTFGRWIQDNDARWLHCELLCMIWSF